MILVAATIGMLMVLTFASMGVFTTAVAAPDAAVSLGTDPKFIGPFTSVVYLVAAVSGTLASGPIRRFGPVRTCQLTLIACAVGMAAFAAQAAAQPTGQTARGQCLFRSRRSGQTVIARA